MSSHLCAVLLIILYLVFFSNEENKNIEETKELYSFNGNARKIPFVRPLPFSYFLLLLLLLFRLFQHLCYFFLYHDTQFTYNIYCDFFFSSFL